MKTSLALILLFKLVLGCNSTIAPLTQPCGVTVEPCFGFFNEGQRNAAWMAAIYNSTHFLCAGTLINRRFVLTAAHCIINQKKIFVKLGAYNKSEPTDVYQVNQAIVHHLYTENDGQNDIGLLKLPIDIIFNQNVRPICIFMDERLKTNVTSVRAFKSFRWERELLRKITVHQLDRAECEEVLNMTLSSEQICTGDPNGDSACGDYGGPLTATLSFNNRFLEAQLGIVSRCGYLAIHTDVSSYVDWIGEQVNKAE